jgi:hypothetical protein
MVSVRIEYSPSRINLVLVYINHGPSYKNLALIPINYGSLWNNLSAHIKRGLSQDLVYLCTNYDLSHKKSGINAH